MSAAPVNQAMRDAAVRDRTVLVQHLPSEMTIAATDRCNLRCVTCGTHHRQEGDNNAGLDDFPPDLVAQLDGMTSGAERIQVHGGGGEPLMSKSFWQWVELFSSESEAGIEFNTNGLLLNQINIARLLSHRVTYISVSCDASTEETYKNMRGGDFGRLLRNLSDLSAERSRRNKTDLRITLNMTITKSNVHDTPGLVRLAKDLKLDGVEFYKLNAGSGYDWVERKAGGFIFDYQAELPEHNSDYIRPFINQSIALGAELGLPVWVDPRLTIAVQESAPDSSPSVTEASSSSAMEFSECTAPWRWLNISAKGDVYPCCHAAAPIGTLNSQTLAEIWNGETMRRLRFNIGRNKIDPRICKGASCAYVLKGEVAPDPITREGVIWAHRLLLGREPENEEVIRQYQTALDRSSMVECLINRAEVPGDKVAPESITREAVIWAYRLLLNREPENEEVISQHQSALDRSAMVKGFLTSPEFHLKANELAHAPE
jgi:radical SAM protein with 4Fe4S-binding SPASM domain